MRSIRLGLALSLVAFGALSTAALPAEEERATAEEVVVKVKQAAAGLAAEGEAGLSAFRGPGSAYVWKDSGDRDLDASLIAAVPLRRPRGPVHA
jgi:hypothetical protein